MAERAPGRRSRARTTTPSGLALVRALAGWALLAGAGCEGGADGAPDPPSAVPRTVGSADGEVHDPSRGRRVPYRAFVPLGAGDVPIVLLSHGGSGNARGHTRANHLGRALAEAGFAAVHVGHLGSSSVDAHLDDRPADVSAVLDAARDGALALPEGFVGTIDTARAGHVGHSFGAYTAHAVGGARFERGGLERAHVDARIDAIVPVSPQGPGRLGAFDRGPTDNSWHSVRVPAYVMVGAREIDSTAGGEFVGEGWRLAPYRRYPGVADTFLAVLGGRGHEDMWEGGDAATERFVAREAVHFLRAYVSGPSVADACAIGTTGLGEDEARVDRSAGRVESSLGGCP